MANFWKSLFCFFLSVGQVQPSPVVACTLGRQGSGCNPGTLKGIGVARIFDWAQTTNNLGEDKKKSSQSDSGFLIRGAQNLAWDQFGLGAGPKPKLT